LKFAGCICSFVEKDRMNEYLRRYNPVETRCMYL